MKRSVLRLSIPLKQPFVTAAGVTNARELLLLRVEAADGTAGYGEAAPFEPYDGVPLERALAALTGGGGRRPPQARAAEEVARLDLLARQEERPLAEPAKDAIAVNMTLPAGPPGETAERARAGVGEGFASFKLKVGLPDDARAGGRGPRGGGPVAGAARRRQRRLERRRGRARHHGRSRSTTSSSSSSPAGACASWPRCASACRRRSRPTSRSPRCASCGARSSSRPATS